MPVKIFSATTVGIDALPIEVEVDVSAGLYSFTIVGLPDKSVEEAKQRVTAAIKNFGALPPTRHNLRIIVNLAPADLKKEGAAFDLPIAIGFLAATGQLKISDADLSRTLFLGELALDGRVRPVPGILPIAEMAAKKGFHYLMVPEQNGVEANFASDISVFPIKNLQQLVNHLEGKEKIEPLGKVGEQKLLAGIESELALEDIRGQETAKRVLEIAATGGHNLLFSGPPGTGKTLLAKSITSILPPLLLEEAVEVTKIYSVAGLLSEKTPLIMRRPFRAPHHTASGIAIVGGGSFPKPGEVSLAHRGVLFLDEFAEFSRPVIENLRQPMEDGHVIVSRVRGTVQFPAQFILVAAMNPCPCGWYGDPQKECRCTMQQILNYQKKISGPILDRIDLHFELPRISYDELIKPGTGEETEKIRNRVETGRKIQLERFSKSNQNNAKKTLTNSEMNFKDLEKYCTLPPELHSMLRDAQKLYAISPRGIHRTLRVARTIADLDNSPEIKEPHLAEALQYRSHKES